MKYRVLNLGGRHETVTVTIPESELRILTDQLDTAAPVPSIYTPIGDYGYVQVLVVRDDVT